jgi:chromate reductase, NAD(P)H dehydrogenase (quinone)
MTNPGTTAAVGPESAERRATRIVGISGSLRRGSYNRKLLRAACELTPAFAAELSVWDGLGTLPPFNEDDEHAPGDAVRALRAAIARADAVLIATPQYNASLPGQLKNALDWASRPYESNVLRGKPVAVIGASPSPSGAARSQAEARTVLTAIGADVLDVELPLARAPQHFDGGGRLRSPTHNRALSQILEQLTAKAADDRRVPAAA